MEFKVKDLLPLRLSRDDEDIIAWLNSKGIERSGWPEFARKVLREAIRRERNPFAAPTRQELADMVGALVRDAIAGSLVDIPLGQPAAAPEQLVSAVEQKVRRNILAKGLNDDD